MAFGKKDGESTRLLKTEKNGQTRTKYGTIQKNEDKQLSIIGLFRFASKADVALMSIGAIFSVIHGSSFSVLALIFGQMTNTFIRQATDSSTPSSNDESSTFGAFFMSEMERFTTVKSITDLEHMRLNTMSSNGALGSEEFYNYVTKFSMFYLYIGLGVLFAAFIQVFCWEISCERQIQRLRKIYYRQILRQEIGWYDLSDNGDLTTKLSDDLERIREGIGSKFSMITQYVSTLISGLIIGLCVDWRLTSITFCVAPFLIAVSGALAIITASAAAREQLKYALAGGIAEEVLSNIRTIAAYGVELRESKRYAIAVNEGRKLAMKKYYIFAVLLGILFVILFSAFGLAFWYGSKLIADGISSPGSIFTVFSVMVGAFSIGNAFPFINSVSVAVGAASTIFNIIDSKPDIDPYSSQGKKIRRTKGKIEFKNVSFSYPTRPSVSVLNSLSFTLKPGQTAAFVGTSGGGKSTIGNLLFRFYDPTEGQVLFDNVDLKEINVHWLRRNIGIVSQEPVLFGVSIAENIRYGQSDCTQQDVIDAAMTANAHSFIIKLPMGYDTLVGDKGSQLSGGQKQRIAIARALVKNPSVLLLDEATSALDAQSEGVVQDALEKAQKNRTTIIIAHRLSTIRNADVIYVLQNGRVMESGTHDVLMDKNGLYSNLVNAQMNTEIDENKELVESFKINENILTYNFMNATEPIIKDNKKQKSSTKSPGLKPYYETDDVNLDENIETQILNEENRKVVERSMEPEKIFTDSFVTENIDGRKVNITRKVSSRKVEKIIYLDQSNRNDLEQSFVYYPCRIRGAILRQLSKPKHYSQWENSDEEFIKDFKLAPKMSMLSRIKGYHYINGNDESPDIENVGITDLLKMNCTEWPWLLLGFIGCSLAGAIMPVFGIFYGQVFSTFTLKGDVFLQETSFWSKKFILLALASGLAWWMQVIGLTNSCETLIMRIRIQAFENILRQPVFWFDLKSSSPSTMVARLARDVPIVKSAGGLRVGQILSTIVTLISALIIAFVFGWKLAIVLVLAVPFIAGAAYKQVMLVQKSQNRDSECMDKAGRIASETVANIKTVQGLAQELMFVTQYEKCLEDPFKAAKKQAVSNAIVYAVSQAVIYVIYAVSFRYGAYLVEIGDMSATNVYRVFFALSFCATSLGITSAYLQDYAKAKIAVVKIFQLIRRKSEIDPLSKSGSKPEIKGKILFKDVTFKYPSRPDVCVLQGVSFTVDPGKTLAIVGESGCGKSTIVSLIERFYDPCKGVIEVDSHDIRAMNLSHLRNHIGIVTQEPILFNCSIKDNIAYGVNDREVTMDEIIDVAKKANIHDFIMSTLAQKYDTLVGDRGNQLSGGQKQRVAIARALIRNPKILLLDEATSALDTESETVVQEALDVARKDRTCIIIAHRLSTIQSADSIAVVHNGKIVEHGDHEELKAKGGYYYQLIKRQEQSYF